MLERIDIFCDVIDNFGDAGVTYRLAGALEAELPGFEIRLFTNDLNAFSALNENIDPSKIEQVVNGIEFCSYGLLSDEFVKGYEIPKLVIEAFACQIPEIYYNKALNSDCLIINLDHLTAEPWIEGVHLKESLTGRKAKKYFFMPGFTSTSGGLIQDRQLSDEEKKIKRKYFEDRFGFESGRMLISIFTYEHDFTGFFTDLKNFGKKTNIIVFGEKSRKGIEKLQVNDSNISAVYSDFILQEEYDDLLKVCDLNFVRGEDSWARACLSGKPFVWHSYHQENNYQQVKVKAFLEYQKEYFENEKLFSSYSEYLMNFNDRSEGIRDGSALFILENLETIGKYNRKMSDGLIKNCNLIKKLLFFARSF